MPEDRESLVAAVVIRSQARSMPPRNDRDEDAERKNAERYRHFVDDLNRSTERELQLAEMRS